MTVQLARRQLAHAKLVAKEHWLKGLFDREKIGVDRIAHLGLRISSGVLAETTHSDQRDHRVDAHTSGEAAVFRGFRTRTMMTTESPSTFFAKGETYRGCTTAAGFRV
jgi:hypothetical protein